MESIFHCTVLVSGINYLRRIVNYPNKLIKLHLLIENDITSETDWFILSFLHVLLTRIPFQKYDKVWYACTNVVLLTQTLKLEWFLHDCWLKFYKLKDKFKISTARTKCSTISKAIIFIYSKLNENMPDFLFNIIIIAEMDGKYISLHRTC